ncbi:MAG: hypothetical protein BRC29_00630 [Nanohaloarchaea archaeon SW_7_43_1]|nr:MAG: hypothetical protein BRC29_00630 [Nanohaloarchaea archaeon SW_7_43_1]
MTHRELYFISTVLAVIGLGIMFVTAESIEPETNKIESLSSSSQTGDIITVKGEVISSQYVDGNLFLTVEDETGSMSVADFNSNKNFQEGEKVSVEGEITLYEGELELIAQAIERQ